MKGKSYRVRPLPTAPVRGAFFVAASVIHATESALPTFRDPRGDHEGIVFWGGRETTIGTFILSAVVPDAEHSPGHVLVKPEQVLNAIYAFRNQNLGLLAQVHSHPGQDSRHSDGDDDLVLAPYEGMLSVVVPHYARFGMRPLTACGIHQFQDGRWRLCVSELDRIRVVTDLTDLR